MGEVVTLPVITTLKGDADRVLQGAIDNELDEVVVVGFKKDGSEYFAANISDGGDVLWHLERAKLKLLQMPDRR